jgi:hypothetical protein
MDERRELIRESLLLAIASRAMLAVMVWLTLRVVPKLPLYPVQLPDSFFPSNPALDGWARWDSAHYIAVARYGYGNAASPSPDGGVGFFPLYPMLMRVIGKLTGQADSNAGLAVIGLILSAVFFLGATALFAQIARETLDLTGARFAIALFLFAPFAFFYTAVYTESLFVLEVVTAIWFARREQWWKAALVAALASATRLVGLAVIAGVLWAAYKKGVALSRLVPLALVGGSGIAIFFIALWIKVDDFFAYFHTQSKWGGWNDHVWFYVKLFLQHPREAIQGDPRHLIIVANVALGLICLALVPTMFRRLDPCTAMISGLLVIGQFVITWVSLGRYLMPAVGIYLAAAMLLDGERRFAYRQAVLAVSLIAMTGLTILFAVGFWVV